MPQARMTSPSDRQDRSYASRVRKSRIGSGLPAPLGDLIERCSQALSALSGPYGGRHDIHTLRSSLADICALTDLTEGMLRAVNRVVDTGDELGELAVNTSCLLDGPDLRSERLRAAQTSLRLLVRALSGARPSQIAVSLSRDW